MEAIISMAKIKELWAKVNFDAWLASKGITNTLPVYAGLFFGVGFASGFLLKKYLKFMIGSLIISILLLKFLEYNHVVAINKIALRSFLGIAPNVSLNMLVNMMFAWIKENIIIFISSIVGFLFGYKLG